MLFPIINQNRLEYFGTEGEPGISTGFDHGGFFHSGLAYISKDSKQGYIDQSGSIVIPLEFDGGGSFVGNFTFVVRNRQFGVIERNKKMVFEFDFKAAAIAGESIAALQRNIGGSVEYFSLATRAKVFESEFPGLRSFSEGLIGIEDPSSAKWGFRNAAGEWIIPPQFGLAGDFSEGLAAVEQPGKSKTGFIEKSGRLVVPYKYNCFRARFSNGLATIWKSVPKKGELAGAINKNGEIVIEPKYKALHPFINGMAIFRDVTTEAYGFLNIHGDVAIPAKFEYVQDFVGELAWVRDLDGYSGYITKKGDWVWKAANSKLNDWAGPK